MTQTKHIPTTPDYPGLRQFEHEGRTIVVCGPYSEEEAREAVRSKLEGEG